LILKPCLRYASNSPLKQCWHVFSELCEVIIEIVRNRPLQAAEECIDVMVSVRTLLHILGWREQDVEYFARVVYEKNENRNYHEGATN